MARRYLTIVTLLIVVTSIARAGTHYYCARPQCNTGIPVRQYQGISRSDSHTALSYLTTLIPVVPLEVAKSPPTVPAPPDRLLVCYQLQETRGVVDHCSVSQVGFQIHSDGKWVLNLQADQNPFLMPDGLPRDPTKPLPNIANFSSHLKRNAFFVRVRGYGNFGEELPADTPFGKPSMFEIKLAPFWVQRGESYQLRVSGNQCEIRDNFRYISRIEFEFFYH